MKHFIVKINFFGIEEGQFLVGMRVTRFGFEVWVKNLYILHGSHPQMISEQKAIGIRQKSFISHHLRSAYADQYIFLI